MNNDVSTGINKAFEKLMPNLTDIIQNRNFSLTVRRTSPNTIEIVQGDSPYAISDSLIEQMNMMINIATLMDGKV